MVSLLAREKIYVNEVVLGTVFGIFMGPYFAGIFDPRDWGTHSETITLEIMRIVLATGLFSIGVELPKSYMARHAKSLLAMVVPTMAIGWVIVAGLIRALFPSLSFISCLGISACLTPTDPIICAAIVGGKFARKHVPLNLRQILSAESAANDGLAYPFLTLAIYLTVDKTEEQAISHWFVIGWLYQVFLGVFIGALAGLAFSSFMKLSHRRGYVDRQSYVAQYLAFAVFITGLVSTLGSDDLLAAFAAGSAISWDGDFNVHTEGESFAHVIDLVLNCGCFMYIGAWLPFKEFTFPELGITPLRLFALAVGIIALRRIPAVLMLYKFIPEISSFKEALFCGHFGPMGVGAVFISTLAMHKLPDPRFPLETQQDYLAASLEPIVAFVVLASIVIHGLSIPFFNISRNVSRTVSLQVTATTASGRRPAPEWLLRVNRFTTRETPNSASPVEKTTSEEIDVEGKAGIGEASNRDVTSRDFAVMSPVSPSPQTYATPDNGSIVESELYHRGSGSAPRNASGSASPATMNAVSVVDVRQSDKENDLSAEGAAPQKSVRFPETRE
ncbi:Sodium/hydrogen exchanger family-domain-containing protein [Coprinopsis sp. MPI-PUGE-AT-0042]|nr:Sodium/hydrogen exchanger family-domain-containing protein [Coprinopsis sp. MPI-PUGE-AT-0042]